jgi:small subunit ribosomal protein S6
MRRYETIFIAHPSLSHEERQPLFDKLANLISDADGLLVKFDEWGQKRLAYEIKKQTRGYYVLMEFCGNGSLVKELERNLRLDDRSLKYMTVCIAKEVDLERVKTEIEAAKAAEEEASQPDMVHDTDQVDAEEEKVPEETPDPTSPAEVSEEMSQSSEEEGTTNGSV